MKSFSNEALNSFLQKVLFLLCIYIYINIYTLQEYLLWKYSVCKLMTWRKSTSAKHVYVY